MKYQRDHTHNQFQGGGVIEWEERGRGWSFNPEKSWDKYPESGPMKNTSRCHLTNILKTRPIKKIIIKTLQAKKHTDQFFCLFCFCLKKIFQVIWNLYFHFSFFRNCEGRNFSYRPWADAINRSGWNEKLWGLLFFTVCLFVLIQLFFFSFLVPEIRKIKNQWIEIFILCTSFEGGKGG